MKNVLKVLASLLAALVATTPTLLFLGAKSFLSPAGFLQNFFVLGLGTYFLGGLQIIAVVALIVVVLFIWSD